MGIIEFITNSEEETRAAASEVAKHLERCYVILYEGEMGAGKTAFTKGLAEFFGTEDEVTSPTFALVHEYSGRVPIFHFDLYRISGYDDLYAVGFFDYLDRGGIIAAEWSETVEGLEDELENVVKIRIEKLSEDGRKITVTGERFGGFGENS